VHLIAAHLEVDRPHGMTVTEVGSAQELRTAVLAAARASDTVIMAAAVADYRPEAVAEGKIKKETHGERLTLSLVKNPDILAEVSAARQPGQVIVGFAAETESDTDALLALATAKIARKGSDYLVVNRVGWSLGFTTPDNAVTVIDRAGAIVMEASGSKISVADRLLDLLV